MMMISANDACLALAEAVSGSAEGFVQAMNERARALFGRAGVRQPHWAQRRRQAMTAREAAVIARELAGHARALEAAKVYSDTLVHSDGRETELVNPNRLVRFYSGCDGLATGSNSTAGLQRRVYGRARGRAVHCRGGGRAEQRRPFSRRAGPARLRF